MMFTSKSSTTETKVLASQSKVKAKGVVNATAEKVNTTERHVKPNWDLVSVLSEQIGWQIWAVRNTVRLLDEDYTVPFIARYRKDQTNSMEADKIRQLKENMNQLR